MEGEKLVFECPECEGIFMYLGGLKHHVTRKHKEKYVEIFGERKVYQRCTPKLDETTIDELNRQSNLNFLRTFNGDISQMNGRNKLMLKREGVLKNEERSGNLRRRLIYTAYGNELLKEIEESVSP